MGLLSRLKHVDVNEARRRVWIKLQLEALPSGACLLDAGAGSQQYRKYCDHLKYTAQDFAEYDGEGDGAALQTGKYHYGDLDIVSDIIEIPVPDAQYDAVLCAEVLEHVPDPRKAICELYRVLKPGGRLILTVPFCSLTHFAPYHFSTGFSRYWLDSVLSGLGMSIKVLEANGDYFEYLAQELNRTPVVVGRYGPRKAGFLLKVLSVFSAKCLARLSSKTAGSEELLCFGYHVIAEKPE